MLKRFIKSLNRLHEIELSRKRVASGKCDYQVNNQCFCTTLISELHHGYHSGWDYIEALFHHIGHLFPKKVIAHELLDRR